MALVRIDHSPESLQLNIPLYLTIPSPGSIEGLPIAKRKVLYLLHGLGDDASAWPRYSIIEILASAYQIVVVMPSVGRSFYLDQANGQNYFSYLVKELPRYLQDVFGLKPKREDTFIAGNSMGGYGAFKAALLHPELYAAAASFSGVLSLDVLQLDPNEARRNELTHLFGDLSKLPGSENDPAVWLKQAAKDPSKVPHLYISCGRQEDIYPLSGMFHSACQGLGIKSEYLEEDGQHDWFLWDRHIRWFLNAVLGPVPTK